eukprot:gnl/TRDRNA2_/TRDRNA2_128942_c1_seq1.p1 gnl/TRDRNA2_/TRDRNA2_128942_c1~~gnl/TRDRNA2_/TRDRNA2_128942_c1_seq1.p1  ORF type:complete len:594 (-),score=88.07 gnl/TRDRNA2_/TRDRNA2_128942_c1_seq1:49-1830(-)
MPTIVQIAAVASGLLVAGCIVFITSTQTVVGSSPEQSGAEATRLQPVPVLHHEEDAWTSGIKTVPLRRELVPVTRRGEIVSYKTSYSGVLHAGGPVQQEFRVIFDTGSGHVVLPSSTCESESCLLHRRYNISESPAAIPVNMDSTVVPSDELGDQATVNFGTGNLTGEFVRERICAGEMCVSMNLVVAREMSAQPFKSFKFDGIVGLGLSSLSLDDEFSILEVLRMSGIPKTMFSVCLTEGELGEESEITFGGTNDSRFRGDLHWARVANPEYGHWQVKIKGFKVGNISLGNCEKCDPKTGENCCRGIVDTGTSHLGIPSAYNAEITRFLTLSAPEDGGVEDCREVDGPPIEIEFEGFSIQLHPENYMRRLPLRQGVSVSSANGVSLMNVDNATQSLEPGRRRPVEEVVLLQMNAALQNGTTPPTAGSAAAAPEPAAKDLRECRPRLIAVNLPEPLGPNLFILGEPVLHRYYTVYDWQSLALGFGEAVSRRNLDRQEREQTGDDTVALMQTGITVQSRHRKAAGHNAKPVQRSSEPLNSDFQDALDYAEMLSGSEEVTALMQMEYKVHSRSVIPPAARTDQVATMNKLGDSDL